MKCQCQHAEVSHTLLPPQRRETNKRTRKPLKGTVRGSCLLCPCHLFKPVGLRSRTRKAVVTVRTPWAEKPDMRDPITSNRRVDPDYLRLQKQHAMAREVLGLDRPLLSAPPPFKEVVGTLLSPPSTLTTRLYTGTLVRRVKRASTDPKSVSVELSMDR